MESPTLKPVVSPFRGPRDLIRPIARLCLSHSIVVVLLAICGGIWLLGRVSAATGRGDVSGGFFTTANWANVLNNQAVPGIVACGVAWW